jgi:hypothetical protein
MRIRPATHVIRHTPEIDIFADADGNTYADPDTTPEIEVTPTHCYSTGYGH